MKLLITGGAGYIGSHMCRMLLKLNHTPIVLDSLEVGNRKSLPKNLDFYQGNVSDSKLLDQIFSSHQIDAIIHFAGFIQAGESVINPQKYFDNNTLKPTALLQACIKHHVKKLIFSSTAAVYGQPPIVPILENTALLPINPYGLSKLYFEQLLGYFDRQYGLKSISLRYFNACGADLDGQYGEDHHPESHIIPIAIHSVIQKKSFSLFGTDYPTPDGTCIRDYIHLEDLCSAHLAALEALNNSHPTDQFNVASGVGWSNRQILDTIQKVSDQKLEITENPRREGDPPELVADAAKIKKALNWVPKYSDLDTIIKSAWLWHSKNPHGYEG